MKKAPDPESGSAALTRRITINAILKYLSHQTIPEKLVLLKGGGPGQPGQQLLRLVHQDLELLRHLLVHNGDEALELAPHAGRVPVGLDEPDVGLNNGSLVLDPVARAVLLEKGVEETGRAPRYSVADLPIPDPGRGFFNPGSWIWIRNT